MKRVFGSLFFAIGMWLLTIVFSVFALASVPLPLHFRYRLITVWVHVTLWWLEVTCGIHYRVVGAENIPGVNGIVLCKHQSAWETLALHKFFPFAAFVVKRELLRIPFFGWGLAILEPIAIDRDARRRAMYQLLAQGRQRLADGRWIVVFPEGTRVLPGKKGHYASGGAFLAEQTGCPVVPVAHNAGEFWPRHGFFKQPGTIQVVIGPVIEPAGRTAQEINELAESWIEGTMQKISTRPTPC